MLDAPRLVIFLVGLATNHFSDRYLQYAKTSLYLMNEQEPFIMNLRNYLLIAGAGFGSIAGCTNNSDNTEPAAGDGGDSSDTNSGENEQKGAQNETDGTQNGKSEADATLSYEITEGSNWDAELPDLYSKWMKWVVVSFTVERGAVSMEDLWFRSRIDTGERYQPADARTDDALENGIQNRGQILEGGSGDILYQSPTFADSFIWNLSGLKRHTVEGENFQLDEPGQDSYGDVTVSIEIEITDSSDLLPPEAEEYRSEGDLWGIVSIDILEGLLNVEDVWFRSSLELGSRRVSVDYAANRYVKRGMRPRGLIKEGYSGYAIYIVSEESENVTWYTEDMKQSVITE